MSLQREAQCTSYLREFRGGTWRVQAHVHLPDGQQTWVEGVHSEYELAHKAFWAHWKSQKQGVYLRLPR